jgi:hypothetical protein
MPEHPAVDWSTVKKRNDGKKVVQVTCRWCNQASWKYASEVASRIRQGTFTGYCYKDRLVEHTRKGTRPQPEHPAVQWDRTKLIATKNGSKQQRTTHVLVICPGCGAEMWRQRNRVVVHIYRGTFTGKCRTCIGKAKKREWKRISKGRTVDPVKGYVRITKQAVQPEDHPIYQAMLDRVATTSGILEHRFVMAKVLGRALSRNELVDHMDGDKTNNDPSNLRLYVSGKNQPGDTCGYGTFYHEWQLALAEIERLKAHIAELENHNLLLRHAVG